MAGVLAKEADVKCKRPGFDPFSWDVELLFCLLLSNPFVSFICYSETLTHIDRGTKHSSYSPLI